MKLLLISLLISTTIIASSSAISDDQDYTKGKNIEWLFVQTAQSVTLKDGMLTLEGISPATLFFSDRPEKLAGHGLTSEFVTFWTTGGGSDNFKNDPPNGALAIVTEDVTEDVVMTLTNPRLDGHTLRYDVTLIEGKDNVEGGPSSLFIDVIGMPLTPMSVAGVRRREVRRMMW